MKMLLSLCAALLLALAATARAQVAAPVFAPAEGQGLTGFDVNVTCATPGASIHYTKNGQTPTQSDAAVASGGTVPVMQNLTLKAKAWSGTNSSAVTSADYAVTGAVSCGTFHIAALRFDSSVFAWGDQTYGSLGNGILTSGTVMTPTSLMKSGSVPFTAAVGVAAGENHTLVLEESGTTTRIVATGANTNGQLGINSTTNQALALPVVSTTGSGTLTNIGEVDAGRGFSLALEASGSLRVYSWGAGAQGRLGNNSTADKLYPTLVLVDGGTTALSNVKQISAGKNFGLAVQQTGTSTAGWTAWSWGFNGSGQLGQGNTANNTRAAQVKEYLSLVSQPVMDCVVAVSAGEDHALAIRSGTSSNGSNPVYNNAVFAWGEQQYGSLGNGETSSASKKYAIPVEKHSDFGGGNLTGIVQIDAGAKISLALDGNGKVWAFGRNNMGAVGDGTTNNAVKAKQINVSGTVPVVWISAGGDGTGFCAALDRDGRLYTWGDNTKAIQGTGSASTTPVTTPTLSGTSVAWTNQPPTGTLSISGAPFTAPATVNLSVNASDPNGNITAVDFFQNSALLVSDTASPYQHTVTGLVTGTYTFGARMTDAAGSIVITNTVQLGIPLPTVMVSGTPRRFWKRADRRRRLKFRARRAKTSRNP